MVEEHHKGIRHDNQRETLEVNRNELTWQYGIRSVYDQTLLESLHAPWQRPSQVWYIPGSTWSRGGGGRIYR